MDANADEGDTGEVIQAATHISVPSGSASTTSATPRLHASLNGKILTDGHLTLHSRQPTSTFTSLGDSFRTWLVKWLANELDANDITLPCSVQFGPDNQVSCSHTYWPMKLTMIKF
jgi:hypothetical protein